MCQTIFTPAKGGMSPPVNVRRRGARITIGASGYFKYFAIVEIFQEAITVVSMVSTCGMDIFEEKAETFRKHSVLVSDVNTRKLR